MLPSLPVIKVPLLESRITILLPQGSSMTAHLPILISNGPFTALPPACLI